MNDLESVPRSIKRWVAALLPDWTVTLEDSPAAVEDNDRPAAVILAATDVDTPFARRSIPQGDVQRAQTFAVSAYPALTVTEEVNGEDVERPITPREAGAAATRLVQLLYDAVEVGTVTNDGQAGYSYPLTIPLWDFTGVPVTGPGREGPSQPLMQPGGNVPAVMEVDTHSVRAIADPDDPRRRTVVLTLRVSWWTPGRDRLLPAAPPIAEDMPGSWNPGP